MRSLAYAHLFRFSQSSGFELKNVYMSGLDVLFWLAQKIDHRHDELYRMVKATRANEDAAAAIVTGDLAHALEQLEKGRNRIWSLMLLLSTPVDDLRASSSELAEELERASRAYKGAIVSLSTSYVWDPDPERRDAAQQRSVECRGREREYFAILRRVQDLPGFKHFREPKKLAELSRAAADGPVVVINVNDTRFSKDKTRCDALVFTRPGESITHVPLPGFSHKLAEKLHFSMLSYLKHHRVRSRDDRAMRLVYSDRNHLQSILACLWMYVVQPILQAIEQTLWELAEDRIPHITWCATGPLAFLPLHAAGIYGSKSAISVSDFVVSSYTPTLSILLNARARAGSPLGPPSILIVSQPDTPGHTMLPGSVKEAAVVKRHFPGASHLNGKEASTQSVLEAMKRHAWVHLACHGIQDARDPMKSAFALHDGLLVLSRLMAESLEHADLAFLSACQTATGDHMLPEEAAHLAGGMLAVGYRSVVATMWSIGDEDAPVVADAFYAGLLEKSENVGEGKGRRREGEVAYVLHDAVKRLREKVGDEAFVRWVAFVHFGL